MSLKGYLIGRRAMWVRQVLDEDDEAGPNHTRLPRHALQAKIIGEEIELYLTNRSITTPPTPLPEALGWCAAFCRAGARASATGRQLHDQTMWSHRRRLLGRLRLLPPSAPSSLEGVHLLRNES